MNTQMKVLVLNCGSSSVKYKLYDMRDKSVMAQGGVEKLGLPDSFLKLTLPSGEKVILNENLPEHTSAVKFILSVLTGSENGCLHSLDEIDAVGHRLVHGGEKFSESVILDDEVIRNVKACYDLAPLHNPSNIKGIEAVTAILPEVPQVGVFDTAFFQSMEPYSYMYPLPYQLYEKYAVRKYGFHGTSHRYVSRRAREVLGREYDSQRIICCHIGNGASVSAIRGGKAVDTSMGMTPTAGLMMGTRCGDIDPGIIPFLMEKEGMSAADLSTLINKKSGVLGISEISSDMRDIEDAIAEGNDRAKLAMEMYNYRIKKFVGAYMAALGGCDILVFTGGVGENQWVTRDYVCSGMEWCGLKLDKELNTGMRGKEMVISTPDSKVTAMVVPTDEELMIARDTVELVGKKG